MQVIPAEDEPTYDMICKADRDPQSVDAHVRRLEALRRTGIVERVAAGVRKVPPDLLQKAITHDTQKNTGSVIELRSHRPYLARQQLVGDA